MVANPACACGQLKQENGVSRSPSARLVRQVWLSRPASVRSFSTPRLNHLSHVSGAYSSPSSVPRLSRRIYSVKRHRASGPVSYQATLLQTDRVHRRESTGTVPIVLKVARAKAATSLRNPMDELLCALLFLLHLLNTILIIG